jgi:hypothetical protein
VRVISPQRKANEKWPRKRLFHDQSLENCRKMLGYSIHVNAMMARWCHSLTSKSNANGEVKDPRALGKFFMENANKGEKKVAKKREQ